MKLIIFLALWCGIFGATYAAFDKSKSPQFQFALLNAIAAAIVAAGICLGAFILAELFMKYIAA